MIYKKLLGRGHTENVRYFSEPENRAYKYRNVFIIAI